MKLDLALISVLLGTATIVGCASAPPAQSPSDKVSTTQLTSAATDAPLPPAPQTSLLGWYTPETDHSIPSAKRPLDGNDPWSAAPVQKAASPAVAPR